MLISVDGWSCAWTGRASRQGLADRRKRRRATLVEILLVHGNRHVGVADVKLLVEVGEFATGILEEETAADRERSAKQVHKEDHEENENRCSVGVIQERLVPSHEFQLVEKPESIAQQDDDGEQQGVRDHREVLGFSEGFATNPLRFWEQAESGAKRRPS